MKTAGRAESILALGAVALGAAAIFHAIACFMPIATDSPAWRHALFAAIDAVVATGLVARPRGFALGFGVLVVQQLMSHGGALWRAWGEQGRIDWTSLAVVVVMPLLFVALLRAKPRG